MMWNSDAGTDYNTNYKKKMCRVLKKVVLRVSGAKESPKETGKQPYKYWCAHFSIT